ncbi:MAG TPA: elongation factor 4 [candidate division WWE3 bacterium]|uniref:Elongation factor 4 n=1 Tax=candidate division WWE3 bacterium TaxID=2053526 RepID=A0A7C1HDH4_UNCKA|nr:elongation factor 4 [candidate division WWE3 bacterium]
METQNIRNFCIIAHIDHGKSTLADRFLEVTKTVEKRKLKKQTMDQLDLEREKGITIKLKAVRMSYTQEGQNYQLNLIDTPGHVDFAYEVSRSLVACEGAILVVDATQGIQAQTVSNVYKALEANLTIIPVINKIDVIGHHAEEVIQDLIDTFGFNREDILSVSAKTGENVGALLEEVIKKVPSPKGRKENTLQGLVFDVFFDDYLGVVTVVKIENGQLSEGNLAKNSGEEIHFLAANTSTTIQEIGIFTPTRQKINQLTAGEVGYIATGLKDIHAISVGDTVCLVAQKSQVQLLPGYKEIKPFVFVSLYPIDNDEFPELRKALEKLSLSDAALSYEPESSGALGFGFRCGFLGLLHADVVQERLEREYDLNLISTIPSVEYKVYLTKGEELLVKRPSELPLVTQIEKIEEPWILTNIVAPSSYVGPIITLCEKRRGVQKSVEYPSEQRVIFEYELPLNELIQGFFDELKSVSSGFASIDYDFLEYRVADVVKMDILVHGEIVEPLSHMVLRKEAKLKGRAIIAKLKDILPRQQFKVSLQAAIGGNIVARDTLGSMGKNVLAKMSGGHRERKDKLLEIQKKGKAKMKRIGKVDVPQEAFREILGA